MTKVGLMLSAGGGRGASHLSNLRNNLSAYECWERVHFVGPHFHDGSSPPCLGLPNLPKS